MSIDYSDAEYRSEPLVTSALTRADEGEVTLRPQRLGEYIGQKKAKENLGIFNYTLMFVTYMWWGGIGSTMPLVIMMLFSKSKELKSLGRACIAPAIFNINEPVIFGTPICFNPIFFIPFVFAPGIMAFLTFLLTDLGIKTNVVGGENLPANGSGRYIFVSNHPLGGLDGMALIALLGHHYDKHLKFIVNDMLMQVVPLRDVFLPANKVGRQSHEVAKSINEAMAGNGQIATFPAGICSRRNTDGIVSDLEWTKGFISKSIEYRRDVVPIFFDGLNSDFFYKMAQMRKRLGIKFNIEMILLPDEMFKNRGKSFNIYIGKPIKWQTFTDGQALRDLAQEVKRVVYNLKHNQ